MSLQAIVAILGLWGLVSLVCGVWLGRHLDRHGRKDKQ